MYEEMEGKISVASMRAIAPLILVMDMEFWSIFAGRDDILHHVYQPTAIIFDGDNL